MLMKEMLYRIEHPHRLITYHQLQGILGAPNQAVAYLLASEKPHLQEVLVC